MAAPNPKRESTAPESKSAPKTFEDAIKILASDSSAPNPYETAVAGESTVAKKTRLRNASRFEVEREKVENAEKRAVGIVGFFGRVPSVIAELRRFAETTPTAALSVDSIASGAEKYFRAANPDRKLSKNSSRLYTGEILEALRLLKLVNLTTNEKEETFHLTTSIIALLKEEKK